MEKRAVQKRGLSRRDFLASAGLGALGITAASLLGGCSTNDGASAPAEGDVAPQAEGSISDVEVIDCELLVIGIGNAALAAVWQAIREGRQVTVVDKGPYRHAGPSGWSWGCYSSVYNDPEVTDLSDSLVHMPAWKNTLEYFQSVYDPNEVNNCVYQVNRGQTLVTRDETGQIAGMNSLVPTYSEQYFRRELDALKTKSQCTIYDNTMITDLLINDGVCLGAMGIHIPSGRFRVFRSKATIKAEGAAVWYYGWLNTKPISLGGADNTGDLLAACYRHGMSIGENEWGFYDFSSYNPRVAYFCQVGGDGVRTTDFVDADGNSVLEGFSVEERAYNLKEIMRDAMLTRPTGPEGGMYILVGNSHDGEFYWEEKNKFQKKYFGFDFKVDLQEVLPEQFEKGGAPVIDENLMTEVEGLFDVRGAGAMGCRMAFNSTVLKLYGAYAGYAAAQFLKSADSPEDIDWQPALDEYRRLTEIRTRESSDRIAPLDIRENIQKTNYSCNSLYREKDKLEAAIAEYERIREEDLPRMALMDSSINWNREWKEAIETINMLDVAEMAARATLMREESRYQYLRPDFPEADNENWKCMVVCRNDNGTMVVEKREIPTL